MQVFIVISSKEGDDQIEGVFSTESIAETYVDNCVSDPVYAECTFMVLSEVVDQFIN